MVFALWTPPLPVVPVDSDSTDDERLIARKCWNLAEVQEALLDGRLEVELTSAASSDAELLGWRLSDVVRFLGCLEKRHFKNSQWCLPPADGNRHGPLPADAYVMGFNRLKALENPRFEPHVYIKFTVRERVGQVQVFSLHQSIR
jgi:hypothetical protein